MLTNDVVSFEQRGPGISLIANYPEYFQRYAPDRQYIAITVELQWLEQAGTMKICSRQG